MLPKILELSFETHPAISDACFEMVGNPQIGIVKVPKLGCLTPNEKLAWERYILKAQEDVRLQKALEVEITLEVVTLMLQSRVNPEWNRESTEKIQNYPLVEALFKFFDLERSNWEPDWDLKLEGIEAKTLAIQYARKNKSAVLHREDILSIYLITKKDSIPVSLLEWKILEDFREGIKKKIHWGGEQKK